MKNSLDWKRNLNLKLVFEVVTELNYQLKSGMNECLGVNAKKKGEVIRILTFCSQAITYNL